MTDSQGENVELDFPENEELKEKLLSEAQRNKFNK